MHTISTRFTAILIFCLAVMSAAAQSQREPGRIASNVMRLQQAGTAFRTTNLFHAAPHQQNGRLASALKKFTLLEPDNTLMQSVLSDKPEFLSVDLPALPGSAPLRLLLYRVDISPNGFTLLTSDGQRYRELNAIVHYRGMVAGDPNSVVSFSVSDEETAALICNDDGNFVIGKTEDTNGRQYVLYNDKDFNVPFSYECGANTLAPVNEIKEELLHRDGNQTTSVKCVNWYYEIDYDIFLNKGSVANVNTYIQNVFNQVATLYNNEGVSITLQTVYVWTSTDPYTGPTTSDFLNQFAAYRTTFAGDLANLVGYAGGGGVAYVNGLCSSSSTYKKGYMGISSSYNNVPTYSWTVEVITHEDGHLLGSRHTHDCAWNGNNTRIDGCGPQAGYPSGSCAAGPIPSSGTIMSYCHLVSGVGINFNNGFGPQPGTLILNNVNNASCLSACSSCQVPGQPAAISGATSYCGSTSQTYSISAVSGATSYLWVLPSGWSGSSTTNTINVTTSGSGGTVIVTAVNSCGESPARSLAVTGNTPPSQPGNLAGSSSVCAGSSQTYSVSPVSGATSYQWTLPTGWTGSSTSNSITVTPGSGSGNVSVAAVNGCGTSAVRSISVTSSPVPAQPLAISGQQMVCSGQSYVYSVPVVSGATFYTWTLPSGWTGSSTSNSITVISGSNAGDITVSAGNSCGSGTANQLAVSFATAPAKPKAISTVGGTAKVCPGDTKVYFVDPVIGATSYVWSPPNGSTIVSGQGSESVTVTYNSGFTAFDSIEVVAMNGCAASDVRFLKVYRNNPPKPTVIDGPAFNACNISGVSYTITNVPGVNYTWVFSQPGAVISSGQGTSAITAAFSNPYVSGTLTVTGSNACGTSAARTLTVSSLPPQPGVISGTISPCAFEQNVPYSIDPVPGADSYTWTVPAGARISDGVVTSSGTSLTTTSIQVTVNFKSTEGKVKVKANNDCGTGANKVLNVAFGCRGQFTMAAFTETGSLEISPNPVHGLFHVSFQLPESGEYKIRLLDITGKILQTITGNTHGTGDEIEMDGTSLTPGMYILEMQSGSTILKRRLVVN